MCAERPARGVEELLARTRRRFRRLSPGAALEELERGELLVDIRPPDQVCEQGWIEGATMVPRNVAEWRLDPACAYRLAIVRPGMRIILICAEGYQTSLLAATLLDFRLDATDVIGGVEAWAAAGLPLSRPRAAVA